MPKYEFCDWEPCKLLQQAIVMFLDPEWRPGEDIRFKILDRTINGQPRPVYFTYCPFCGTRLRGNKEVVSWVRTAIRSR